MKKKVLVPLFILLFSIFWFSREIFGSRLFCFADLTFYFYPYRYFMVESIKNGVFPLWNPYINLGFPFLATLQHGLLYPLSIIYFIFPFDQAFNLFLIIHYPLAAYFMYFFCRELKCSVLASLGGGIAFGFSGYLISVLHMPTSLASIIWLPLVFMYYKKILDRQESEMKNIIILGVLLAVMFLGGEPTIILCTGYLLLGYLICRKGNNLRELLLGLYVLGIAMLLFLAVDAIQILPFVELMIHSVRMGGMTYEEIMRYSLPPYKLIETIVPYFFNISVLPWLNNEWIKLSYIGIIPMTISVFALVKMDRRKAALILFIVFIAILLIIGKYSPLPLFYFLNKLLPGFKYVRYPSKMLFLLSFIIPILTAYGIDYIGGGRGIIGKTINRSIIIIVVMIALMMLILVYPEIYLVFISTMISAGVIMKGDEGITGRNLINLNVTMGLLLLLLVWIKVDVKNKVSQFAMKLGLVILITIDLYLANVNANFSICEKDFKIIPENVTMLMRDKMEYRYIQSAKICMDDFITRDSDYIDYKKTFHSLLNQLVLNQNMRFKISACDGYESIQLNNDKTMIESINKGEGGNKADALNLMNVKYLITDSPYKFGWNKLLKVTKNSRGGYIYLFENVNCLPRSFYVPKAKIITDRGKGLDYITSPKFAPLKEVVLEEQVDAPNGIWFTSERFYPGWKAFADGKEVKIYRANFMFRAVALPAKNSKITYVYDPLLFKIGLVISLTSIFGIFAYFTCSWANKLKRPRV